MCIVANLLILWRVIYLGEEKTNDWNVEIELAQL